MIESIISAWSLANWLETNPHNYKPTEWDLATKHRIELCLKEIDNPNKCFKWGISSWVNYIFPWENWNELVCDKKTWDCKIVGKYDKRPSSSNDSGVYKIDYSINSTPVLDQCLKWWEQLNAVLDPSECDKTDWFRYDSNSQTFSRTKWDVIETCSTKKDEIFWGFKIDECRTSFDKIPWGDKYNWIVHNTGNNDSYSLAA